MKDDLITIKKSLRLLKLYAGLMTGFFMVLCLSAFTSEQKQNIDEITAKRITIVDANGMSRVIMGADYKRDCPGVFFFNEDGHENGAFCYHAKRDRNGTIDAYSLLTMDQFKSDQVVVLEYEQAGDQKRQGLTVNDRPDMLSPRVEKLLQDLGQALHSAKSEAEAQALRKDYLSRIPAREIVARRLFAGRDVDGTSLVTLSDPDGKPRLRLQVDKLGKASITFLDASGQTVRTIKP